MRQAPYQEREMLVIYSMRKLYLLCPVPSESGHKGSVSTTISPNHAAVSGSSSTRTYSAEVA